MLTYRRALLVGASALIPAALLAACAGQTATQITQQVVTYGLDVANALATVVQGLVGVSPTTQATLVTDVQAAVTGAQGLSTALTTTEAQPFWQQVQSDLLAVTSAIGSAVQSTQVQQILQDINLVLGVALPLVGLFVTAAPANADVQAAAARLHALPRVTFKK